MSHYTFYQMFVDLLREAYASEMLLMGKFPALIKQATHSHLQEALSQHLDETKSHQERLKKISSLLGEQLEGASSPGMSGLLEEGEVALAKTTSPAVKDACLIIAFQKIEHYEMANYGSAYALACQLSETDQAGPARFDTIANLLEEMLEEESAVDERLTEIAEGGFFSDGINDEAGKEQAEILP